METSYKNPYEAIKPLPKKTEKPTEKAQYLSDLVGISYNEAFRFVNKYPTLDKERITETYFRLKKWFYKIISSIIVQRSSDFTEAKQPNIAICSWNGKHTVIMRKVHSVDFSGQVVDGTKGFIVIAFVKQLHLVWRTATRYDQILVLFTELASIEQAGIVWNLYSLPIEGLV